MGIIIAIFLLSAGSMIVGYYLGRETKSIEMLMLKIEHHKELNKLIQDHTKVINEFKEWILRNK